MPVDDPLWDVLDEVDALQTAKTPDDARSACRRLGELLDADVGPRAKQAVLDYASLATGCVRRALDHALAQSQAQGVEELTVLTRSWLVRSEPALEDAVQTRILNIPAASAPEQPEPEVTAGEPGITGKIAREAIEAAFRRELPLFATCYKRSDASYEGARGEVKVRFTIALTGKVTQVREESASLEDEDFRRCVRSVVKATYFREAEGESRVVLPIRFAPGAAR
jgi:TonB family protein